MFAALREENFDIGPGLDLERVGTRYRAAHFRNSKSARLAAAGRGELEAVVPLEGPRRVEANPPSPVTVFGDALDLPDGGADVPERHGVYDRAARRAAVEIQLGGAARKDGFEVFERDVRPCAVEDVPVVAGDGRDIEGGLHAPFYLQGDRPRVDELRHILAEPEILHREGICLPALPVVERRAAAVCAPPPVAAPVLLHRGKEA